MRAFSQVDVFSAEPLLGNPVAVVHDADGLTDDQMAAFARWTNLSETTYLLAPTDPDADYRLRIWTPGGELPFAGHPTLGSAHAWLEAGGVPGRSDEVVQECGAGLVRVRRGERLAFAAPPLIRSGPVAEADIARIVRILRIEREDMLDAAWIDNGPGWVGAGAPDAAAVLAVQPDFSAFDELKIGVVGRARRGRRGRGGARVLPAVRHPRGPGHRQPQRRARAVAGRRPSARRRTSRPRARCCSAPAGCTWGWSGTTWCGSEATP